MTSDDAAPDPPHVPLPPEQPSPDGSFAADDAATGPDDVPPLDLTKGPAVDPAEAVAGPTAGEEPADPGGTGHEVPVDEVNSSAGREWWRADDVRDELRDTWYSQGGEAAAAAQEIGYQMQQAAGHISDAVAAATYPAAKRRGLDIRWMRLSINGPAIVLALLATWGGRTATDRMVHTIATDGPFAPLGVVLFFVLVGGLLLLTPIGTPLAQALAHLVTAVAQGLVSLVRRAWSAPVTGYLMRLVAAVFVWAFVFGILRVAGRAILHWLTGV